MPLLTRRRAALAAVAVAVLVLVVVPAVIAYSSLHPARCGYGGSPGDQGLRYESFRVTTEDGVEIKGWLVYPQGPSRDAAFVVMHGYTSCKADPRLLRLAAELAGDGYYVVLFDFRGHGESGGSTTIGPKEVMDARAVVDWLLERLPGVDVYLVGYSMGGAVAVVYGSQEPRVDGIVADSPYYKLGVVAPRWIGAYTPLPEAYGRLVALWGAIMAGESLDFGPAQVGRVDKPLLVIYGTEDPLVTPGEMREIAGKASCCPPPGCLVEVPGAGHVEAWRVLGLQEYVDLVESVAEAECPGQP